MTTARGFDSLAPVRPFKAIAAMSLNRVIGAGDRIPWHLPEDFKWFKQMTTGHIIVMGRKTFEFIGKPLPNRETLVLSRGMFSFPGVRVVRSLEQLVQNQPAPELASGTKQPQKRSADLRSGAPVTPALNRAGWETGAPTQAHDPREIFICGGAQIYAQALPLCSDLFLTLVKREVAGDAFFPPFEDQFELAEEVRDTPEFKILHYRARQS